MNISQENIGQGNRAMAAVLLLYYHMHKDGGFGNDQTVYLDELDFNGFDYLDVVVEPDCQPEIDGSLLRQGAVIYLLCDLNDIVGEYEDDFHAQPALQKITAKLSNHTEDVPEVTSILQLAQSSGLDFDFPAFQAILSKIYQKYVISQFTDATIIT